MDTLLTAKLRIIGKGGKDKQVSVVAASEDSTTGARADDFCASLARSLGTEYAFNKQSWPLTELRLPQLRAIAAEEAARADMVIVSVHHAEALPAELTNWIEQWVHHKHKRVRVLLALFDPIQQGVCATIRAYLADIAQQAHIDFLAQSEETMAEA